MATIYLVRHGQASFGAANYDKLSELGCRQAEAVGEYFAVNGIHFDAIYSGDLVRQCETADRLLAAQPGEVVRVVDPRFNEINNDEQFEVLSPLVAAQSPAFRSLFESGNRDSKSYQKMIEGIFNYWVSPACQEASIQSWSDYSSGVSEAMKALVAREGSGKTIAVCTSGGTIATVVSQVLGLGGEYAYRFYEPIFNCSISQLFYNSDKVSLSSFNDISFMRQMGKPGDSPLISYR